MKRETKLLLVTIVALITILSIGGGFFVRAAPTLTTDKLDYPPDSTVYITGTGWTPNHVVTVTVTRPTGDVQSCSNPYTPGFQASCSSANSSGSFAAPGYVLNGVWGDYYVYATDGVQSQTTTFTDAASVDFRQCANNDSPFPLNSCHWINGILQSSNSRYAEGMSVPQRVILDKIPSTSGNVHTITFHVDFTKAGVHAYDWLTGYNQGNTPPLTLNPCGPSIGNSPDFATICNTLRSGSNTALVDVPDDSFSSNNLGTPQTVVSKSSAYEITFGNRQVKLYSNSPISSPSLTLAHDVAPGADTGDSAIDYTLTWTSSGSELLFEFGGHLAVGGSKASSGIDWGPLRGASSISGGPYHVSLDTLDGHSLGNQDNQITTGTITPVLVNVICTPTKGTTGKPISCTATGSGGTPPYTYTFSAPGGSPSSGSGSGASFTFTVTYATTGTKTISVTVTDAAGAINTQSVSFMVNPQPKTLTVNCGNPTAGKPVTCNASSQGGTTPITFSWSAPGGSPSSGLGTSFTTAFPAKGPQNINVTQTDGDGLVVSRVVALNVAGQPLVVNVNCGTGQTAGKPFTCVVSATGGTPPYTGTGSLSRTEPVKGTFTETFSVTDVNHVTASGSASVTVVQQPFVQSVICSGPFTAGKPFSCTVSATGGTQPYTGTGTFSVTQPVKGTFTESFTVRDANGKSAVASTQVTVVQQPFSVSAVCTGPFSAGKAFSCTVSASGGTQPYTGTGTFSVAQPVKGTFTESFNVKDGNGKTAVASTQVTVVQQPFVVSVTCGSGQTAGKPFSCTVSATGGTAPYTGTGTFGVTQPVKGTFTESFTVTDSNGKSAVASTQVTVVQQPFVVSVTCGVNSVGQPRPGPITAGKPFNCIVSATGGTAPYQGTGIFSVTQPVKGTFTESFHVSDANGKTAVASTQVTVVQQPFTVSVTCGSSTAAITAGKPFDCVVSATGGTGPYQGIGTFSGTQPVKGSFTESFDVSDANGKTAVASTTVDVVQQPFVVSVDCGIGQTAGKPFSCTVSATGGTQPYGGTGTFSVTQPVKGAFTERFTVTDANHKSAVASTTVDVVQQPFTVSVDCGSGQTAGKPFSCTVSATGGTQPYGGTGPFSVTQPVKGTFTERFTVTDANHKSAVASTTVTVVQQPFVVSVSCGPSIATGQVTAGKPFTCTVSATGGTAPYQGTGDFTVTEPVKGTFHESFDVKDANGKTAVATTTVTVVQQPFVVSVTCGASIPTGQVTAGKPFTCTVSTTGGTGPYHGTGDFTVTQPVKGDFQESFTVTDANGKSADATTTVHVVQQPFVVSVTCGSTSAAITAGKPFSCTVSATGGTQPYQGTGTFSITEPVKGSFTESFNVMDANGKTAVASTSVTVVQQPFVVTVHCGSSSAAITAGKPFQCSVSATGGTGPYQGTGTFTVTEPVKGTFQESFDVKDANGKTAVATTSVTVVQQPFVVAVTCGPSVPTGQITAGKPFTCTVSATGGTGPYQGTGSFTVTQPVKGTFTESFTVQDANGKTAVASTQVHVVQQPFVVSVTCGSSTEAITAGKPFTCTVSASGGTGPYQGTGDFVVTEPVKGTFTESFTVGDSNGKTAVASVQVTVVQQPFVVSVSCGSATAAITAGKPFSCAVSATGGTAPYQGTGIFTVTEPVKGSFHESFDVRDANGKTAVATTTVTVVQQPFVVTVTCGTATAAITAGKPFNCTVSATGGTAPYQGTGDFTVTEPVKGTFHESFDVKDANGKTATATTTVTVVQQPFVVSVTCGTAANAITAGKPFTCVVSASGGTAPYQGTGSLTFIPPVKGSLSEAFVVKDANGKTAIATTTVNVIQQPFVVSVTCGPSIPTGLVTAGKPFTCTVSATGGTAPYQGTGSFTVTEPVKGTFKESFTVSDANHKTAVASVDVQVVQQPFVVGVACTSNGGGFIPLITAGKPFSCFVDATGGTAPYTGTGVFQVTEPVKGLFTERFPVSDANGKTAIAATVVTVFQQPFVVSVTCGTAANAITAGKPFTCTVSATGGTAPYQGTGSFVVTEPVKGTFVESFPVSDANGKTAVASTQVTVVQQPFVVSVTCGASTPTGQITAGKPFACTVSATGGTQPYHGTGDFTVTQPVKGTFTESFTVTDANGKSAVASTHVTVIQQPFVVSVTCGGSIQTPTGSIITAGKPFTCHVSASGGTAPYQGTGNFQVTEPVKGTFHESFNVKDANGKTAVATTTVTVVQQPFVVSVTCGPSIPTGQITSGKPFTCTVSATGGTAPYRGTGNFVVVEPVKGTFVERFQVSDSNGKTAIASVRVTVVQQPFVVSVTCGSATAAITAGKPFTCTVSASGGTAPYQGTGTFTVTEPVKGPSTESFNVEDANGKTAIASTQVTVTQQPFVVSVSCGSATAAITAGKLFDCLVSATGGTAPYQGTGTFTVTEPVKGTFHESFDVKDANGKTAVATTTVTVVQQPFVVSVSCGSASAAVTAGKPFSCTVSATGGTAPYQGTGTFTVTEPVKGSFHESFDVKDANGKTAVATTTVTVVQQPFVVTVSCGSPTSAITAGKPFSCTVSATGGTSPYQGTGTFTVTEPVKGTFHESFDVKDANGKTAVATTTVTVVQQPFVVSVTCGSASAAITAGKPFSCTVSATGGTQPYQGTGIFTVTEPVKGSFTESFNVKDANGKTAVASTMVHVVQQPFVVSVTCGSSTAAITAGKPFTCTVSATGGTQPYQGTGTFTVTVPVKGTFTESFNVADANGKSAVASTLVTVVQQPFVVSVTCSSNITAGKPFTCTVSAVGGTGPYTGTGSFTITQPVKGTFTESFTVRDANGKSAIASTTVTVVQQPFVASVTCTGPITAGKPFTCTVSATGGTSPYQGTGTFTVTQPVKGTFTESFTVRDANGKSTVASTTVIVQPQPLIANFTSVCSGSATVFTATVSGGTSPYSFSWSFGDSTTGTGNPVSHIYGSSGSFTVTLTVTDSNGQAKTVTHSATGCGQPVVVTDTSFCRLPNNNFVLIFITDPQNPSSYRLVASNPGQFYDNVFYSAAPGSPVTLNIQVPYPFITNGAYPIQISSSYSLTSQGCFVPSFDNPSGFTITAPGPLSPSGHPTIVLSNYSPQNFGSTVTVTVTGTVPASGLVYVTIHLDYGLKGTTGWLKGVAQGSSFQATNSGLGLSLNNGQSYSFSVGGSESYTTSVTSSNVFKKDPGIAGVITSATTGNPIAGATVKIYDNNGMLLGITTTDQNGVYLYFYKYTGSKVNFTVKAILSSGAVQTTIVQMQSNKVVLQSFAF